MTLTQEQRDRIAAKLRHALEHAKGDLRVGSAVDHGGNNPLLRLYDEEGETVFMFSDALAIAVGNMPGPDAALVATTIVAMKNLGFEQGMRAGERVERERISGVVQDLLGVDKIIAALRGPLA